MRCGSDRLSTPHSILMNAAAAMVAHTTTPDEVVPIATQNRIGSPATATVSPPRPSGG